jgi:hypothetical protein
MKTYAVRLKVLAQATSPLFRKAPSIFAALECNTRCVMLKEHADFIPIRPQKIYSEDTTHFLARILPYTFTSAPPVSVARRSFSRPCPPRTLQDSCETATARWNSSVSTILADATVDAPHHTLNTHDMY